MDGGGGFSASADRSGGPVPVRSCSEGNISGGETDSGTDVSAYRGDGGSGDGPGVVQERKHVGQLGGFLPAGAGERWL